MIATVTGPTGLVGSHLIDELLENKYQVRAMVRQTSDTSALANREGVEIKIGDITQHHTLSGVLEGDVVFNNAAIMNDWVPLSKLEPINVAGTRNVLEIARKYDIPKIVHTSSTAVYGFPNEQTPLSEDFPKKTFGDYQKSKWLAEQVVQEYIENYGLDIVIIRPTGVLGPHDRYTMPTIIEAIQTGQMRIFGNGKQTQSYVHARDVGQCLRLAAETSGIQGEAFNVTSFDIQMETYFSMIADLLGVDSNINHIPYRLIYGLGALYEAWGTLRRKSISPLITRFRVKLFGTNYLIDSSKAQEVLGYQPKFDCETTLRESLQWYFTTHPNQDLPTALQ